MHRRIAVAALVVSIAATALAAVPGEAGPKYFRAKPSGILCGVFRLHKRSVNVRCDLPFRGSRAVFLHTRGKATIKRVSSLLHPRHRAPRLRLGATRGYGPFTCSSGRTSVYCRSGDGHGFRVGPKFQLVF